MIIRPAEPADADSIAAVHVASWQVGYRGLLPDEYLDALRPEDRARRYVLGSTDPRDPVTLVAVGDGGIRGFVTTAPARDDDQAGAGEVCALYVEPDGWGTGAGRALISAARGRLAALGFDRAVLWVLRDNARAERFYRIDGWAPDGSQRSTEIWGIAVDESRFHRALR